jgi:hypothetical protein
VCAVGALGLKATCTETEMKIRPNSGPQRSVNELCFLQCPKLKGQLNSYEKWPLQQSALGFIESALAYTGGEIEAIRFYCAGGLKGWKEEIRHFAYRTLIMV